MVPNFNQPGKAWSPFPRTAADSIKQFDDCNALDNCDDLDDWNALNNCNDLDDCNGLDNCDDLDDCDNLDNCDNLDDHNNLDDCNSGDVLDTNEPFLAVFPPTTTFNISALSSPKNCVNVNKL